MIENTVSMPEALAKMNSEEASILSEMWEEYNDSANRLRMEMRKSNIDNNLLTEVIFAAVNFYTHIRIVKPERMNQINSRLSEGTLSALDESRTEAILEALSENEEFCDCFKLIDNRLNELLKIVPVESRSALYEIESAIGDIISISNNLTYKQGFQDGINLIKQAEAGSKSKYLVIEFESRRKDACRRYKDSKTGSIYRILKIVREYTDEAEADQDLARLKAGEIHEYDIFRKRKRK